MDILIPTCIVIAATIFYILSQITPKTDLLLYGLSAVLFLTGGVMGMSGFNDFYSSDYQIVVNETIQSGVSTYNISVNNRFEDSIYLNVLPALFVLLSLYMLMVLGTEFRNDNRHRN